MVSAGSSATWIDIAWRPKTRPQPPQVHVPHPQPPPDAMGPASVPEAAPAANEYRRRARSLPQFGQDTTVSTDAVIGRRSSNRCSQAMHTYS
jgi:hypothetical protein